MVIWLRLADGNTRVLVLMTVPAALALGAWVLTGWFEEREIRTDWLLTIASLNFFVVVPEFGLRMVDFRFDFGIEFGYPRATSFMSFVPDEQLFWRLSPDSPRINSEGFVGSELPDTKPPGTRRVLFLGDSVTQQGYPRLVETFLNASRESGNVRFESVSLAVAGYSSHQGRVLADLYGSRLEPDAVVVFFGWNDHWLAYGASDAEKVVAAETPRARIARKLYREFRLIQLANWIVTRAYTPRGPLDVPRVSPARYRENLEHIRNVFRGEGALVFFVTAPTSIYSRPVSEHLVDEGFARDNAQVREMHRVYNDVVREFSDDVGVVVVDLERGVLAAPPDVVDTWFMDDRIHLRPDGLAMAALSIYRSLIDHAFSDEATRPDGTTFLGASQTHQTAVSR